MYYLDWSHKMKHNQVFAHLQHRLQFIRYLFRELPGWSTSFPGDWKGKLKIKCRIPAITPLSNSAIPNKKYSSAFPCATFPKDFVRLGSLKATFCHCQFTRPPDFPKFHGAMLCQDITFCCKTGLFFIWSLRKYRLQRIAASNFCHESNVNYVIN